MFFLLLTSMSWTLIFLSLPLRVCTSIITFCLLLFCLLFTFCYSLPWLRSLGMSLVCYPHISTSLVPAFPFCHSLICTSLTCTLLVCSSLLCASLSVTVCYVPVRYSFVCYSLACMSVVFLLLTFNLIHLFVLFFFLALLSIT